MGKVTAHVAIFRNNQSEVLLSKRRDMPLWVLPGGHQEKNEEIEDTAIREVAEETGLNIKLDKLVSKYTSPNNQTIKYLYKGEVTSGTIRLSKETSDIKWFPINKLPFNLLRFEETRIQESLIPNQDITNKTFFIDNNQEMKHFINKPFELTKLLISYIISKVTTKLSNQQLYVITTPTNPNK